MAEACAVCGKPFRLLTSHSRVYKCITCGKEVGSGCFTETRLLDGREGPICNPCWPTQKQKAVVETEILNPTSIIAEFRRQAEVVRDETFQRLQSIKNDIQGDVDKMHASIKSDLDAYLKQLDQLVVQWLQEANASVQKQLRSAFAYLWIVLCSTGFLTIVTFVYYQMMGEPGAAGINPVVLFRLSAFVLAGIPWTLWLLSAFLRAARAKSLKEFRNGRRLGLRDYLFGFVYFKNPVENLWGPVAMIGSALLALVYLMIKTHECMQ